MAVLLRPDQVATLGAFPSVGSWRLTSPRLIPLGNQAWVQLARPSMWAKTVNPFEVDVSGAGKQITLPIAWRERDTPPACCGRPTVPRLARAHDRLGQTLFVTVWQCPVCGRVSL